MRFLIILIFICLISSSVHAGRPWVIVKDAENIILGIEEAGEIVKTKALVPNNLPVPVSGARAAAYSQIVARGGMLLRFGNNLMLLYAAYKFGEWLGERMLDYYADYRASQYLYDHAYLGQDINGDGKPDWITNDVCASSSDASAKSGDIFGACSSYCNANPSGPCGEGCRCAGGYQAVTINDQIYYDIYAHNTYCDYDPDIHVYCPKPDNIIEAEYEVIDPAPEDYPNSVNMQTKEVAFPLPESELTFDVDTDGLTQEEIDTLTTPGQEVGFIDLTTDVGYMPDGTKFTPSDQESPVDLPDDLVGDGAGGDTSQDIVVNVNIDWPQATPQEPDKTPPEKDNLTNILTTFVNNIPFMDLVQGIQCGGGQCSFTTEIFGQTGVMDFCRYESVFQFAGIIINAFAIYYSWLILFKGS